MGSKVGRLAVAAVAPLVMTVPAAAQEWLGVIAKADAQIKAERSKTTQIGSWSGVNLGEGICLIGTVNPAGEILRYVVRAGENGRMVEVNNDIQYSGDGTSEVAFQFDNVIWDQDMIPSDEGDLLGIDRNDARIGRAIRRSARVKASHAQGEVLGWTKLTGAEDAMDWVEACAGVPSTRTTPKAAPKPAPTPSVAPARPTWTPTRAGKFCVVLRRDPARRSVLAVSRSGTGAEPLSLTFQYPAVATMAAGAQAALRLSIDGRSTSVPFVRTDSGLQVAVEATLLVKLEAASALTVQDAAGTLLYVADYADQRGAFASLRNCPAP